MSTDLTIRTDFRAGDLSFLISSHVEYYQRELGYTLEIEYFVAKNAVEFYKQYQPDRSRIWIVEQAGRRVGSLVLQDRGAVAQLRYFIVLPEVQGRGIGQTLMDAFQAFAREKGYTAAYLWTTGEQSVAVNLYEKTGFGLTEQKAANGFGWPLVELRYALAL